ncbi:MAG: hypothetical protein J6Z13_01575, partial [Clostridia bacterium]|nr:hypothetical protein [Clostridia bacterium]
MLGAAGFSAGLYTSPNLVRVNERIQVDGEPIPDADLDRLLETVEKAAKETEAALHDTPTQFEIWTAIAFLYFKEKRVDYVVLETGLGGEFDATNVIPGNVAAILTKIDLDHTEYLGDTIEKIAETKSKIIKEACESGFVISAPQVPEAERVIRERADSVGVTPVFVEVPEPGDFFGICLCGRGSVDCIREILPLHLEQIRVENNLSAFANIIVFRRDVIDINRTEDGNNGHAVAHDRIGGDLGIRSLHDPLLEDLSCHEGILRH